MVVDIVSPFEVFYYFLDIYLSMMHDNVSFLLQKFVLNNNNNGYF